MATRGDGGEKVGSGSQIDRRHLGEKCLGGGAGGQRESCPQAEGQKCPTQRECEEGRHLRSEAQAGRCPRHVLRASRDVSATPLPAHGWEESLFLQFICQRC